MLLPLMVILPAWVALLAAPGLERDAQQQPVRGRFDAQRGELTFRDGAGTGYLGGAVAARGPGARDGVPGPGHGDQDAGLTGRQPGDGQLDLGAAGRGAQAGLTVDSRRAVEGTVARLGRV